MSHSIVCTDLSFDWADGTAVFSGLNAAFDRGRTGLIGRNGSGKSTLLKLITGRLAPDSGTITTVGDVGYLDQRLTLDTGQSVADLLGIARTRAALRAIEAGDASEANFTAVGDDWDIEERAIAELARFGISLGPSGTGDPLDRTVGTLSGGEAVLTGLAGLLLRRPAITLLDEPTNNLDRRARGLLYEAVDSWRGVLVVVSHDRELLDRVDQIAELRDGRLRTWGGNYTAYTEQLAAEQEAAQRMVRAAEAEVRREKRQLVEARTKLDRRLRYGNKMYESKREPKIVMNARKREAQVSAGKHRIMQTEKVEEAEQALAESEAAVRDDDRIRIALPDTDVPAGRDVLQLATPQGALYVRGPERIALVGDNGSGKTTLLRAITGGADHPVVRVVRATDRIGYLPQRLDILDDRLSVMDNVRAAAPSATPHEVRANLARFLIRGDRVDQTAGELSGGERFRVSLACLLLADPPPQLLVLDEPTNNLDLDSVRQLTEALAAYRGALLVAGHDTAFLADIGVTRWWRVERGRAPVDTDPLQD
ncbi:ABC-F family ATP-binding cassette domain-containing protein [Streptomonospora nanhaiensis]|uniref:ATPase subunit of ABC transporter with duplicated ATPase domains n=1 Tax=Streptomonospora nanhaiensis TaxID=1323731 RepID=A0A853BRF2_9ACTN|nr:ABC-F family ATP-binding cassette domain-containing protein [Streptomonospora nanhaiensis]MBV2366701.1 ATP-binding cassette domain-containing protein [Streptomonospora nanhaiensis]MBX9387630.1 ATP-binding cassette domain-containing protein [Streptomonospora nanhaiensis]NYI97137.1 ATPase subunit of ABC transporter with duplicated ATPase domains [Streptomonospora nanhaiensis]